MREGVARAARAPSADASSLGRGRRGCLRLPGLKHHLEVSPEINKPIRIQTPHTPHHSRMNGRIKPQLASKLFPSRFPSHPDLRYTLILSCFVRGGFATAIYRGGVIISSIIIAEYMLNVKNVSSSTAAAAADSQNVHHCLPFLR